MFCCFLFCCRSSQTVAQILCWFPSSAMGSPWNPWVGFLSLWVPWDPQELRSLRPQASKTLGLLGLEDPGRTKSTNHQGVWPAGEMWCGTAKRSKRATRGATPGAARRGGSAAQRPWTSAPSAALWRRRTSVRTRRLWTRRSSSKSPSR